MTRKLKSQRNSNIRFWVLSFENIEINKQNIRLFCGFVISIYTITIVVILVLIIALSKLELFDYVIEIISAFKA